MPHIISTLRFQDAVSLFFCCCKLSSIANTIWLFRNTGKRYMEDPHNTLMEFTLFYPASDSVEFLFVCTDFAVNSHNIRTYFVRSRSHAGQITIL